MTLQQLANEAMDYLDSVGVAADYHLTPVSLAVKTDHHNFVILSGFPAPFMDRIKSVYPPKKINTIRRNK